MKPFLKRILLCVLPVLLAGAVVGVAVNMYLKGEGGFKLGVDLVGGTTLVYETDPTKELEGQQVSGDELAAALKRRIDPVDLLNVLIRPIGNRRVEIILPTGGAHRARIEEQHWEDLLDLVAKTWPEVNIDDVTFGRARWSELPRFVQDQTDKAAWSEFLALVRKEWPDKFQEPKSGAKTEVGPKPEPKVEPEPKGAPKAEPKGEPKPEPKAEPKPKLEDVPQADLREFLTKKAGIDAKAVSAFYDKHYETAYQNKLVKAEDVLKVILDNYRPASGKRRDVTGEEVKRIKDLISQVGALEFRILANERDDPAAVKAAREFFDSINDPGQPKELRDQRRDELGKAAEQGVPPPPPGGRLRARGSKYPWQNQHGSGETTYSWVELDRGERLSLNLDNAAADPKSGRSRRWLEVEEARKAGRLYTLTDMNDTVLYSRNCTNFNITLHERAAKQFEYFVLTRDAEPGKAIVVGREGVRLPSVTETVDKNLQPAVAFRFNNEGGNRFYDVTSVNRPSGNEPTRFFRHLAIILDDKIISAPRLQEAIRYDGQITGNFKRRDVEQLVSILRSGALPTTLKPDPVSESTTGPTLGQETIEAGTQSVLWAFVAVLAFMIFYYRFAGIVACIALFANLLMTIGFMVMVNATFTLPGLAGLVLMLAMAVDANVLIYERIREERERGASLALAIRNGYDRAFPTIIDTHLTSIFTAIVLYAVGNDQLKGFGISLTVGLIISLFTALYMTRLMFDISQAMGWLKKLGMLRILTKTNINFMSIRVPVFFATMAFVVVGTVVFLLRGEQGLNIDFVGGTAYGGQLNRPLDIRDLRNLLDEKNQRERLQVKEKGVQLIGEEGTSYQITYSDDSVEEIRLPTAPDFPSAAARAALQTAAAERTEEQKQLVQQTIEQWQEEVRKRASELPDWSVEHVFVSRERHEGNRSRFFNIRTTEKAPDLVQVTVYRLFQARTQDGRLEPLLRQLELKDFTVEERRATLEFSQAGYAKPDEIKALVEKEAQALGVKVAGLQVTGEGPGLEGRFDNLKLEAPGLEDKDLKAVLENLKKTLAARPAVRDEKSREYHKLELKGFQVEAGKAALELSDIAYASRSQVQSLIERQAQAFGIDLKRVTFQVIGEGRAQEERYQKMRLEVTGAADTKKLPDKDALTSILTRTKEAFEKRPQPERLEVFDSPLAAETRARALYAILGSWGAILLYLWFRFGNWTFGLAAVLCLIHDVLFTLGIIAFCHYIATGAPPLAMLLALHDFKIDLPAVASLLTLIGYSVNDTIVVFDRIREVRGKNPELTEETINDSINQTLSRTVLTSFITWLTVLVLYIFGGDGVHLFAFVMVVGVIVGTYSSIYVASPLLLILGEGRQPEAARRPEPEPEAEPEREEEEEEEEAAEEHVTAKRGGKEPDERIQEKE